MERIAWLVLGAVTLVAALRAGSSPQMMYLARGALVVLMIVFGAAVNAAYLLSGSAYYESFADASPFDFVRDTWATLVLPNQWFFITLLIAAELAAGALVAAGGAWMRAGLVALIAFHVGQLAFGWFMWAWALPMIAAFVLLLRAQKHTATGPLTPHPPRQATAAA